MRIIYGWPSGGDGGKMGVAAYDLTGFLYQPSDTDPSISCLMSNSLRFTITCSGKDADGVLSRIVEDLLSPTGVADCRNVPGLRVKAQKSSIQRVLITNKWAQTVTEEYYDDPEHPCLVVSAITS